MKPKKVLAVSILFFVILSSLAHASDNSKNQTAYIAGYIGATFLDDAVLSSSSTSISVNTEFDTGLYLGGAFGGILGYDFGGVRLEGEIGYRKNDIDKYSTMGVSTAGAGDSSCLNFMLNGFFDIQNQTSFTPYLGAGLGFAKVSIDSVNVSGTVLGGEDDTVFAYQFGGGIGYAVTDAVTLDLAYRYFATSDPEFGITTAEYSSHNVLFGIRYGF